LNTILAYTARKNVYQRTILPNLSRKILSPMNPLAASFVRESGAVEIQASQERQIRGVLRKSKQCNLRNHQLLYQAYNRSSGAQDTTAMRKNIRGLALLALAYIAFWPVEYSVAQDQPRARELKAAGGHSDAARRIPPQLFAA
jgi:hypothetical protein